MKEFYKNYLQAFFIVLHFTSLTDNVILQIEGLWQPCVAQVYWRHFSNSICSLHDSMSHFSNSHNFLSVFIIITLVMVMCDQ